MSHTQINKKKALYPGSFDPFTLGHLDILLRGLNLFDEVTILLANHSAKIQQFKLEDRLQMIKKFTQAYSIDTKERVKVQSHSGLLVDYARTHHFDFILRGIRNGQDFDYELQLSQMNKTLYPKIDTFFCLSDPKLAYISSTLVRDILQHGGCIDDFVPKMIAQEMKILKS